MNETTEAIGFVGLGHMGGNMAARFLQAGYDVYGTAKSQEHAGEIIEKGLQWRDTPREVAAAADVVCTSLPNDQVVDEVASDADGIIAGMDGETIWVDLSTISPHEADALAARASERGATMLSAPVSGSVPQVKSGTLTIMVGGDAGAYKRVEQVLRVLGTPNHVGDNGHALVLKLAINISLAVQTLALSEGLLLAERAGMDTKVALDVMTESAIASPMLKGRAPLILDLPDEAWFDVGLMQKDIRLALDTARRLHVPLPTTGEADEVLSIAQALGYERRDLAGLFQVLERISAQESVSQPS
jgi:3-hydroxyisobutyrate dehydrogenase-like beta-hydroxyacid dehydrogenase